MKWTIHNRYLIAWFIKWIGKTAPHNAPKLESASGGSRFCVGVVLIPTIHQIRIRVPVLCGGSTYSDQLHCSILASSSQSSSFSFSRIKILTIFCTLNALIVTLLNTALFMKWRNGFVISFLKKSSWNILVKNRDFQKNVELWKSGE